MVKGSNEPGFKIRAATTADAPEVAWLHAESWRRHYRGAYADEYLDEDADADRLLVWTDRLAPHQAGTEVTLVAEIDNALVAFVHVELDEDPRFGALVDNLHVSPSEQRRGIGARLLTEAAHGVTTRRPGSGMYLWMLEQNRAARSFYLVMGGTLGDRAFASTPGGRPERLAGNPLKVRVVWPKLGALAHRLASTKRGSNRCFGPLADQGAGSALVTPENHLCSSSRHSPQRKHASGAPAFKGPTTFVCGRRNWVADYAVDVEASTPPACPPHPLPEAGHFLNLTSSSDPGHGCPSCGLAPRL